MTFINAENTGPRKPTRATWHHYTSAWLLTLLLIESRETQPSGVSAIPSRRFRRFSKRRATGAARGGAERSEAKRSGVVAPTTPPERYQACTRSPSMVGSLSRSRHQARSEERGVRVGRLGPRERENGVAACQSPQS